MVSPVKALLSGLPSGRPSGLTPKAVAIAAISAIALPAALPAVTFAQATDIPVEAAEEAAEEATEEAPEAVDMEAPEVDLPSNTNSAPRAVEQSDSPIGIAAGQALMSAAESDIAAQNYTAAATNLVEAREALNDVSSYYQNLSSVFVGVDSRVTSDLRDLALQSAQVRDQASYQLAVVYRAQSRPDLAVPLLVEIVGSQQPTRELGQQAYQQLYELGFVGVPYNAPGQ